MRGLPPIGDGVLRVDVLVQVNALPTSWSFWTFAAGAEELGADQLTALLGQLQLLALPLQTSLSHAGATCAACRCTRFGAAPLVISRGSPPNVGAWTGGQMSGATLTLNLQTGERGRGRNSLIHVPGFPDAFTTDGSRINQLAYGNALASATDFLNGVNSTPLPDGGRCVLGTLHRRTSSGPLSASVFAPTIAVGIGATVGMLRRRRGFFRAPSPS